MDARNDPRRSPAERRHRTLLVVLVLLALLHPLWSRLVDRWWDGAAAPPPATAPAPAPADPAERRPLPPAASTAPAVEPASTPPVAADAPAAAPSADRAAANAVDLERAADLEREADAGRAAPAPTVLGASIGAAAEVQVLVDLHGADALEPLLGEICLQAQLFVERALSRQQVRVHSQSGDAPAEDLGRHRCP